MGLGAWGTGGMPRHQLLKDHWQSLTVPPFPPQHARRMPYQDVLRDFGELGVVSWDWTIACGLILRMRSPSFMH